MGQTDMAVVVPRYDELFDKLFDYKFSFISPIRQGPTFCWGQLQLGLNSHSIATGPEWKTFIFSPFSIIAAHFPFLQAGGVKPAKLLNRQLREK